MDNDFNTAVAIASLFGLADKVVKIDNPAEKRHAAMVLKFYANLLGLKLIDLRQQITSDTARELMMLLIDLRNEAKNKKDYATSDRIRLELSKRGITIKDKKEGSSTWEVGAVPDQSATVSQKK